MVAAVLAHQTKVHHVALLAVALTLLAVVQIHLQAIEQVVEVEQEF